MSQKLLFVICLFLIGSFSSFAQIVTGSEVIASSGNSYASKDLMADWTVGESIIFSGQYANGIVSQGFQQPMICRTLPIIGSINETSCLNAYTLTVTAGFHYYQWKLEKGFIVNHKTNQYNPVEEGNYTVLVGDSTGCLVPTKSIYVDLSAKNIVPTVIVHGTTDKDTLIESTPAATYQWYLVTSENENPRAIIGATNKSYKPIISGKYYVKINTHENCVSYSLRHDLKTNVTVDLNRFAVIKTDSTIELTPLSFYSYKIDVYPNPAKGKIFIDYESPEKNTVQLEFYNIHGILIDSRKVSNHTGKFHKEFDELNFPTGPYLLKIKDKENTLVKSIILE